MRGWSWWLGIALGVLLVVAGIAETARLTRSGDGGFAFWFGTLVGGGVLILTGTLLRPRRPVPGFVISTIGCLAGILPTAWTVLVPVLLLVLVVATARETADAVNRQALD